LARKKIFLATVQSQPLLANDIQAARWKSPLSPERLFQLAQEVRKNLPDTEVLCANLIGFCPVHRNVKYCFPDKIFERRCEKWSAVRGADTNGAYYCGFGSIGYCKSCQHRTKGKHFDGCKCNDGRCKCNDGHWEPGSVKDTGPSGTGDHAQVKWENTVQYYVFVGYYGKAHLAQEGISRKKYCTHCKTWVQYKKLHQWILPKEAGELATRCGELAQEFAQTKRRRRLQRLLSQP